jgi:hypothetical protein
MGRQLLDGGAEVAFEVVVESALSESSSKSACVSPSTSSAASRMATSFSRCSTFRRSLSASASAGCFFGRAGLVRLSSGR